MKEPVPSLLIDMIPKLQWGLVNFDASTLWVRNRKHLTDALDVTPEFLRTKQGDAGIYYLCVTGFARE